MADRACPRRRRVRRARAVEARAAQAHGGRGALTCPFDRRRASHSCAPRIGLQHRLVGLGACCSPPRARSSAGELTSYGDGRAGGCFAALRSSALRAKRRPPRRCAASNARAMRPSRRIRSRCPALSIVLSRSRLAGTSGIGTSKVSLQAASVPLSLPLAYRGGRSHERRLTRRYSGATVAHSDELPPRPGSSRPSSASRSVPRCATTVSSATAADLQPGRVLAVSGMSTSIKPWSGRPNPSTSLRSSRYGAR